MFNAKLFFPLYGVVVILAAVDSSPLSRPRIPGVGANDISSGAGEVFGKADSEKKLKFNPPIEDELFYEDYVGQPDYGDYIGNPSVFDAEEDNRPTVDKDMEDDPRGKPPVIPAPGSDEEDRSFDEDGRNDADEEDDGDENKIDQPPADDVDKENGTDDDERKPLDGEDEEGPDEDEARDESSEEDDKEEKEPDDDKTLEQPSEEEEEENSSEEDQSSDDEDETGNEEEQQEDDNQDEESNDVDEEEDKVPDEDEDKNHDDEEGEDYDRGLDEIDENSAEENIPGFSGGFVLDTPFFNIRQVTKYFQQLERALEHVFRQTMDEAILLNGTYANTTEEEVEIDGKKYLVQKSIIKSGNKNGSIYIEALSAEEGKNRTQDSIDGGL